MQPIRFRRASVRVAIACFVTLATRATTLAEVDQPRTHPDTPQFVQGRIIVRFETATANVAHQRRADLPNVRRFRQLLPVSHLRTSDTNREGPHLIYVAELDAGTDVIAAARNIATRPGIRYAEPDYIVRTADTIPDDTEFDKLWGLRNTAQTGGLPGADIHAPQAWDITTGSGDVIVAVIDTGVDYNHPDLAANIWTNPGESGGGRESDGIDNDNNGYIDDVHGYDFLLNDSDPMDAQGHGTHVAGTIAGAGNNNLGVVGVNWTARIMALRFLSAGGSGPTSAAAEALYYATDNGARLTSNSWGGGAFSETFRDALEAARDADVLFVAAAGNNARDNDGHPHYPSGYEVENVIAVASTDHNDELSSFSNWGANAVDLAAPGSSILSTVPPFVTLFSEEFDSAAPPAVGGQFTLEGASNLWGTVDRGGGNYAARGDWQHADPYLPNADGWLVSPAFDTTGLPGLSLAFSCRYEMEDGADALTAEVWNGSEWVELFRRSSDAPLTEFFFSKRLDLEPYRNDSMRVRFGWQTDGDGSQFYGTEIDDISMRYIDSVYTQSTVYAQKSGTSMATPHVAGVAALLLANDPSLCMLALKARILWTGDPLPALQNVTVTNRRLNAHASLLEADGSVVEQPNGGETWYLGSTRRVQWSNFACVVGATVNVVLMEGESTHSMLASNAPNTGSFDWPIPENIAAGTDYRIRIDIDGAIDESDAPFELRAPIVLYVDDNAPPGGDGRRWETAFNTVQDSLNAASALADAVAEVRVAAGSYRPAIPEAPQDARTATFTLPSGLTVRGGFAGYAQPDPDARNPMAYETVLSGDLLGNDPEGFDSGWRWDNAYHVVTLIDADEKTALEGFTISGGNADGPGDNSNGGGIWITNGEPTIAGCTLRSNTADANGGALYNVAGSPIVMNCTIAHNRAADGGGMYTTGAASPRISDTVFISNDSFQSGGGVYNANQGQGAAFIDCLFTDNHAVFGGGMRTKGINATLMRCRFMGNAATGAPGGGGIYNGSNGPSPTLSGCVIIGNTAQNNGGGVFTGSDSVPSLTNCTIARNSALRGGGMYLSSGGAPAFSSCVLWSNVGGASQSAESAQIDGVGGAPRIDYSSVQGWSGNLIGTGSIGDAPQFVDGLTGNWTGSAVHDSATRKTTLTDASATWTVNALTGKTLNPDANQFRQAVILSNTVASITVWGDFATLGAAGTAYEVHDIHLSQDSPCINTGDPNFTPGQDPTDIDGDPRVIGCRIDMGADEAISGAANGNADADADVDLHDFAAFQACFGETLIAGDSPTPCLCTFDFDSSGQVDLDDFRAFQERATGW